jgi:rhomboid family GlyGly-CTERM serine protease
MRPNPRFRPIDWLLPVAIVIVLLIVMHGGEHAAEMLRYQREAVLSGEAWRLLTGHLVHADGSHLLWNILGLALVFALFAGEYSPGEWSVVMLASTAAIDLGFLAFEPQIAWYVGLSGVLHGLMTAGLAAWLRVRRDPLTVSIAVIFVGKLIWEHMRGPLPFIAESLTVPVIHEGPQLRRNRRGAVRDGAARAAEAGARHRYNPPSAPRRSDRSSHDTRNRLSRTRLAVGRHACGARRDGTAGSADLC